MGDVAGTTEDRSDRRKLTADRTGRADAVLAALCPDLSRARIQRLIAAGHVLRNGEPVRKSGELSPGDELEVIVPDVPHEAVPVDFDLEVLYEDTAMLAVNKPPGLAVHGAPGDTGPSVAAWMLARLGDAAAAFDAEHPGIVHRLDKDTSGILLLAKTPTAQEALSRAFEQRTTKKTYLALTRGVPNRPHAVIDAAIARHPGDRTKMAITNRGRGSRTEYEVLFATKAEAFLLVRPETGRTHQIRVHLAAIGATVLYDRVYGVAGEGRQMLHAYRISVPHPGGGRLIVTAPLAPDMEREVSALGARELALQYALPQPPVLSADGGEESSQPLPEAK